MMRWWSELSERLRALFSAARADAELREEMAFHFEREVEANRARGMSEEEATHAARIKLGDLERFAQEVRDERGARGVRDIGQDIRIGWRGLRRAPLFTIVVMIALGLGIGGTTAVFGLISRVLLQPLPGVLRPHELVLVHMQRDEYNYTGLSYLNFHDLRAAAPAFSSFAGYSTVSLQVAPPVGEAIVLRGSAVIGDYFGTLGVRPSRGRFFTEEELTRAGDAFVIVLAAHAAARLFPDGDAVGGTLHANGHTFRVIGVAPATFRGVERLRAGDAWVPPGAYVPLRHLRIDPLARRGGIFREFFGRLHADATPAQAEQQLRAGMASLMAAHPAETRVYERNRPTVFEGLGMAKPTREMITTTLRLLFGVSLLVLLIACANVANLLVFRGVVRRGEAAVRRALGASVTRLLQQHFAEGLLIAALGAAAGLVVALLLTRYLSAEQLIGAELAQRMTVDWRLLGFTSVVALLVSLAFAAVPTLLTRRLDLTATLRQTNRGETGRLGVMRGGLVVVQLGASVALIVVSLLLTRTISALNAVELGFDPGLVVAFGVSEEEQGYDEVRLATLQQQLLEQATGLAEVEAVALTASAPFSGVGHGGSLRVPGWPEETESLDADVHFVSPDFFRVLDVRLLDGRTFTAAENSDSMARVVVLNRTAAERLFGSDDVVGRTVQGGWSEKHVQTVIGVVEDIRHGGLREPVEPATYLPLATHPLRGFHLVVRTRAGRTAVEPAIRQILAGIDPKLPFFRVNLIAEGVQQSMARERFLGRVTGLLAAMAALLAAVGLYGLLAYAVAQRTREIGIRIALGARPLAIVRWVTAQMLLLACIGLGLGLAGGAALARIVQSQLYGVSAHDPVSNVVAALGLLAVGCIAAALPAHAAVRVEPAVALRGDLCIARGRVPGIGTAAARRLHRGVPPSWAE